MANVNTLTATVLGVFSTRARAEEAVSLLQRAGFGPDQIGLVARNYEGKVARIDGAGTDLDAGEAAAAGAAVGAAGGALVGAGVVAGVIPVIGPVLAIGTLGTILLNAVGGAAVAGVAGALIGWGVSEDDAKYYEGQVQAGRYLVTVDADNRADEAREILFRCEGYDRAKWDDLAVRP